MRQLDIARRNVDAQMARFGYSAPNVDFRKGYIEDLKGAGIADNSVDVVISNCVINLSPDKPAVFSELFRVLKPGGRVVLRRRLLRPPHPGRSENRSGPAGRMPLRRIIYGRFPAAHALL